jgi:IclR family acetate operon transcriptional repressor
MNPKTEKTGRRGESPYHSRAVSRALRILKSFTLDDFELSVGDLHDRLGIPKSTLVRLLQCMAAEGFVEHNAETSKYRLGIKLFELGSLYEKTRVMNVGALSWPYMQELVEEFELSSNLAIRAGREIVYVRVAEPRGRQMRMAYSVGDRFGLHHTALGKAMMAFMPEEDREALVASLELKALTPKTICTVEGLHDEFTEIRDCGYAVDDEESLPGLRCVAAPIWGADGVMAALSLSGSTLEVSGETVETIADAVKETTRAISVRLGGEEHVVH